MWKPRIRAYKKNIDIRFPCAVEVKIDGEFVYWNGHNALMNKRQNPKNTISRLPREECYGELYYGEGKEFYSEIHSHSGIQNKVILFDTKDYGHKPYIQRRTDLEKLGKLGIEITPMIICHNENDLSKAFEGIIKKGYEGCVIKPLDSLDDSSWVKMKKEYTATLKVLGLRKGKTIPTLTIGTADHIYCSVSCLGWNAVVDMLNKEKEERGVENWVIGENKENILIKSNVVLEVKHNGLILPSNKLRHPRIKRIRSSQCELSIQKGD